MAERLSFGKKLVKVIGFVILFADILAAFSIFYVADWLRRAFPYPSYLQSLLMVGVVVGTVVVAGAFGYWGVEMAFYQRTPWRKND